MADDDVEQAGAEAQPAALQPTRRQQRRGREGSAACLYACMQRASDRQSRGREREREESGSDDEALFDFLSFASQQPSAFLTERRNTAIIHILFAS